MITYLKENKKYFVLAVILLIIISVSIISVFKREEKSEVVASINIEDEIDKEEEKTQEYYFIDIKGEVNNPGVYKLIKESRVIDAINAAGGLLENANTRYINLSKKVEDEMNIIIYSNSEIELFNEKEIIEIPCKCENIKNDSCIENIQKEEENELININTANKEELMTLNGIGESKASAIIEYRNKKTFENIEEILEVSGISDAIYNKIKDFITAK